jgi:hypothetical protein
MDLSDERKIFTSNPQAHGEERGPLKYPYSTSSLRSSSINSNGSSGKKPKIG